MAPVKLSSTEQWQTPPADLETLRLLSLAIARGEAELRLSSRAQQVLAQMLELSGDQALLSISTLARRLDVNPSTISRLARALGYKRFGDLQSILLSERLNGPQAFYRQHANAALAASRQELLSQAQHLSHEHSYNIERFQQGLSNADLEGFAESVMGARRVRLFGVRQFHALASFLSYGLGMLRSDVTLLSSGDHGVAEGLAALSQDDVLIVGSCKPYTRHVVDICRAAHDHGIHTIAITDLASSPLVPHSDLSILVPHETSFVSNSMVAFTCAAECLVNACATHAGDSAAEALTRRDMFITALNIEQP